MLFFGFHWSFTILEPSGKGWPLPGTPALYALIMVGLATITLSTSSVRAEETTAQSSYPLKSEKAIPLGDFSVSSLLRFMADPFLTKYRGLRPGGPDALGGLFDERCDRPWLRNVDGVAALDLDDRGTRPLRHGTLGNRRDHLILGDN